MNQYWLHLKKFLAVRKMHLWPMKCLMALSLSDFIAMGIFFSCYKATMAIQVQSYTSRYLTSVQVSAVFFEMNNAACSQANFHVRSIELSELFIYTYLGFTKSCSLNNTFIQTLDYLSINPNTISSNPEIQTIPFTLCSSFK